MKKKLHFIDGAELSQVVYLSPKPLVSNFFNEAEVGIVYASPKRYKTLLTLDLSLHMVHEQQWLGELKVEPQKNEIKELVDEVVDRVINNAKIREEN